MTKKNNSIILDRTLIEKFLMKRERASAISGAMIVELDKKIDELKREVEETDKQLRCLL